MNGRIIAAASTFLRQEQAPNTTFAGSCRTMHTPQPQTIAVRLANAGRIPAPAQELPGTFASVWGVRRRRLHMPRTGNLPDGMARTLGSVEALPIQGVSGRDTQLERVIKELARLGGSKVLGAWPPLTTTAHSTAATCSTSLCGVT